MLIFALLVVLVQIIWGMLMFAFQSIDLMSIGIPMLYSFSYVFVFIITFFYNKKLYVKQEEKILSKNLLWITFVVAIDFIRAILLELTSHQKFSIPSFQYFLNNIIAFAIPSFLGMLIVVPFAKFYYSVKFQNFIQRIFKGKIIIFKILSWILGMTFLILLSLGLLIFLIEVLSQLL